MKRKPQVQPLTPDQLRAADAFVEAAEESGIAAEFAQPRPHQADSGGEEGGRAVVPNAPTTTSPTSQDEPASVEPARASPPPDATAESRPYDAARDDVVKAISIRFAEPLYERLKHASKLSGVSMNRIVTDSTAEALDAFFEYRASHPVPHRATGLPRHDGADVKSM